jgi:hypothetical protein
LIITDHLEKNLSSISYFHFAPDLTLEKNQNTIKVNDSSNTIGQVHIENAEDIRIERYLYSPAYSVAIQSYRIIIAFKDKIKVEIVNLN